MAARRAKLVQRSSFQGLQGNPDACRPGRGSACSEATGKTGGNAGPVFALSVQLTAAMGPWVQGPQALVVFPPLLTSKAAPRPGRPAPGGAPFSGQSLGGRNGPPGSPETH